MPGILIVIAATLAFLPLLDWGQRYRTLAVVLLLLASGVVSLFREFSRQREEAL